MLSQLLSGGIVWTCRYPLNGPHPQAAWNRPRIRTSPLLQRAFSFFAESQYSRPPPRFANRAIGASCLSLHSQAHCSARFLALSHPGCFLRFFQSDTNFDSKLNDFESNYSESIFYGLQSGSSLPKEVKPWLKNLTRNKSRPNRQGVFCLRCESCRARVGASGGSLIILNLKAYLHPPAGKVSLHAGRPGQLNGFWTNHCLLPPSFPPLKRPLSR